MLELVREGLRRRGGNVVPPTDLVLLLRVSVGIDVRPVRGRWIDGLHSLAHRDRGGVRQDVESGDDHEAVARADARLVENIRAAVVRAATASATLG
jgi:hypothetical protein